MEERLYGKPVARFAKILADAAWWFVIAGTALGLALLLISAVFPGTGFSPTTSVHVSVPEEAARQKLPLISPDTVLVREAALEDVEANVEFETSEPWPILLGGVVAIPAIAVLLFGLYLVRSFLRDVLDQRVFTAANARRMAMLGWLLIAAGLALPILKFLYTALVFHHLRLQGVPLAIRINSIGTVIPGILALVVASAWRYGVELQQDRDLTV